MKQMRKVLTERKNQGMKKTHCNRYFRIIIGFVYSVTPNDSKEVLSLLKTQ